MKRTLITAAAIYLLHDRQRRVERRLQEHRAYQLALKTEMHEFGREWSTAIREELQRRDEAFREWAEHTNGEIERAFKRGAH